MDDSEHDLALIKQTLDASAEYAAQYLQITREALEMQMERNLEDLCLLSPDRINLFRKKPQAY